MKSARTDTIHSERKIHKFTLDNKEIDIYLTKHGQYRILEQKQITFEKLGNTILSIGAEELEQHFNQAHIEFPLQERQSIEWEKKVDYVIVLYDTTKEITYFLGLHPHLSRITLVTIIPRIHNVELFNVYGCYAAFQTKQGLKSLKIYRGIEND